MWVEAQAGTTFTGDDINMVLQVFPLPCLWEPRAQSAIIVVTAARQYAKRYATQTICRAFSGTVHMAMACE